MTRRKLIFASAGIALLACSEGCGLIGDSTHRSKPVGGTRPSGGPTSPPPRNAAPTRPGHVGADGDPYQPLYELPTSQRVVALTIDDGPNNIYTPQVLDLLAQYEIHATFCLIGENVQEYPSMVRAIASEGHQIANHTWDHGDLRHMADSEVYDQLARTSDLIESVTHGRRPYWFRSPGGDWSDIALQACVDEGMRPLGWSVDPEDWATPGTDTIIERVLDNTGPGSIVLNHDGGGNRSQTVEALREYLPYLLSRGYRFTTP